MPLVLCLENVSSRNCALKSYYLSSPVLQSKCISLLMSNWTSASLILCLTLLSLSSFRFRITEQLPFGDILVYIFICNGEL